MRNSGRLRLNCCPIRIAAWLFYKESSGILQVSGRILRAGRMKKRIVSANRGVLKKQTRSMLMLKTDLIRRIRLTYRPIMISLMRRLVSLQRNCSGENLARSVVRPYIRILIRQKNRHWPRKNWIYCLRVYVNFKKDRRRQRKKPERQKQCWMQRKKIAYKFGKNFGRK